MNWLKLWWRRRGERLCAENRHSWRSVPMPVEKMGHGDTFAVNMAWSMFYDWAQCKRCGKSGYRLPAG